MVTMVTLHIVVEENREQAVALLKKNTELARKAKGFISRQILFSVNDPLKGYSITTWETREDLRTFASSPERPPLEYEGEERQVYEITSTGRVHIFSHTNSDIFEEVDVP